MADIYKLIPAGFSFKKVGGYNILMSNIIGRYFEHARGSGTDLFIVKIYTENGEPQELCRGYIPTGSVENALDLRVKQIQLDHQLDNQFPDAKRHLWSNPKNVYQNHSIEGYDVVFVKCRSGYFACGWYDNAKTRKKGLKMASFMVYAYGIINAEQDAELWEVCYKYLPYDSELGRVDIADNIIVEGLREEVLKANNAKARFVKVSDGQ